jgi:hypothetical protein
MRRRNNPTAIFYPVAKCLDPICIGLIWLIIDGPSVSPASLQGAFCRNSPNC